MPKITKSNQSSRALLLLAMIAAMGAGAVMFYVTSTPNAQHVPAVLRRTTPEPAKMSAVAPPSVTVHAEGHVLVPSLDGDKMNLTTSKPVPEGTDPKIVVADAALEVGGFSEVRCLGVQVKSGVALVSFTRGILDGSGSMGEGDFVRALQVGFSQFKDVQKVQVTYDGKPVDTLGHLELSEPSPVLAPGASSNDPT